MNDTGYAIIFITASSEDEVQKLSDILLKGHHAACITDVKGVESTYWWQGKLESAQEHLLIVKTRTSQIDDVTRLARENHSYEIPEVMAIPVIGGNSDYLDWVGREVTE
jgi:periplasmic divalent cation tolerance protein